MSKTLYLVLDMQNDLVHADGAAVGFVRVGFSPEYTECPRNSPIFSGAPKAGLFKLGSFGTEVHPALAQRPGDVQVVKHRVSPFYSTTLEAQLRALGITRIVCSGVSTQAVVQATVRDGHDRDYAMVVLEDCCAAHSEEEHRNSMGSIARFCTVTTSDQVDFAA